MLFVKVIRQINKDMRSELKMELTSSQIHLLRLIEQHGPLKMSELAEELRITLGGVTSLANRMDKANLIKRKRSEEDRRIVRLELTEEGVAFLDHLTEARNKTFSRRFGKLTPDQLAELKHICKKMLD
ncbi:MAG TPA: MarR family transcriptional regulator [Bacillales bacterium]|nr:MarR family transcriptional regulator [Bacillales bacterium]